MRRLAAFLVAFALLALRARSAEAEPPSPELMSKLAHYAAQFDAQLTRASYAVEGRMELLDSDGKVDSSQELEGHVDSNGGEPKLTVIRFVDDGKDKTVEAATKARESEEKRKKKRQAGRALKMPIGASQQPRYVFDQVETDASASRARITFAPREPADDTVEGSAWVNTVTGTVISAGFKLSKTPMFVDYVHCSVEFGASTSLGPAVSSVRVEGKGGILFFRKHFVATAALSDYAIAP